MHAAKGVHVLKNFWMVMTSVVLLAFAAQAQTCPTPAGDDTLTLAGVMRNFGRALLPADKAAQAGTMDPADVSDAQLSEAIQGIQMAEVCAQATIEDKSGALWPSRAKELSGEALQAYIALFRSDMQAFADALVAYRLEFEKQQALPVGARAYATVDELRLQVRERAKEAHGDL